MKKYWQLVKEQYRKDKDYEKYIILFSIIFIIYFFITKESLIVMLIFTSMSAFYVLGIPFLTYRQENKQLIVTSRQECMKQEFLSSKFDIIDSILLEAEQFDNANKVGALIETGKKLNEVDLKECMYKHEECFKNAVSEIDKFYYNSDCNINEEFCRHNLKKFEFIKRRAYIEKRIEVIKNPAINRARIVGKEWLQLIISIFGGFILGKFTYVLEEGYIFLILLYIFMGLIGVVFMVMSSVYYNQSMKNDSISYYSTEDLLKYEKDILNKVIRTWNCGG